MAWQATFDVITSWPFMRPPRKTGGKSLYALVPFWSWNTLQHYLVDVMMKQKSFFVQGNLNFALMYRNNIKFSVIVDCEIYWEYRTASHLLFWNPWPVTGHIATAKNFTRKLRYKLKKITLSLHSLHGLHSLQSAVCMVCVSTVSLTPITRFRVIRHSAKFPWLAEMCCVEKGNFRFERISNNGFYMNVWYCGLLACPQIFIVVWVETQ